MTLADFVIRKSLGRFTVLLNGTATSFSEFTGTLAKVTAYDLHIGYFDTVAKAKAAIEATIAYDAHWDDELEAQIAADRRYNDWVDNGCMTSAQRMAYQDELDREAENVWR